MSQLLLKSFILGNIVFSLEFSESRCVRSHLNLVDKALLNDLLLLQLLLLELSINGGLGLLKLCHMTDLLSRKGAVKVEFELVNANFGLENRVR